MAKRLPACGNQTLGAIASKVLRERSTSCEEGFATALMYNAELMVRRHSPVLPCLTTSSRRLPSTILKFDWRSDRQMNIEGYVRRGDRKESCLENGEIPSISLRRGFRERTILRHQLGISWPIKGGTPITESTAIALRRVVFGQCPTNIRTEYFSRGPGLIFREAERDLGYALTLGNAIILPVVRSILMAIQAHILRFLLFEVRVAKCYRPNPMTPSYTMQQEALCMAFTDIMWKAGGGKSCVVCLPHPTHRHVSESERFNCDGVTEKLYLFKLDDRDGLYQLFRRHLFIFQQDPGPAFILLVYSAVLSRGIERVVEDMGARLIKETDAYHDYLLNYTGDVNLCVLNLFLIGRASPYLHNGIRYQENEDNTVVTQVGVPVRSSIGLLIWMRTEEKTNEYNLGSRLKTPLYPIWVTICSDHSGVLFSDDRELLRDYRSEIRFKLHYFSGSHHQQQPAILIIRTRMRVDETDEGTEESYHVLDRMIRTKWGGARVFWNGQTPFL